MKKLFALALCAVFALMMFAGCSGSAGASDGAVKIGIIKYMDHTSLDEITAAVEATLSSELDEQGVEYSIDTKSANGDPSTINAICTQFVADGVDLVVAIATPAAQGAATVLEGTGIPLVFSAVTDPVDAGLVDSLDVPGGSITGTSDAIPVSQIMDLAAELTPDAKNFGILYCTSEPGSVPVVTEAKEFFEANGYTYEEGAVADETDVQTVVQNLLKDCDAIFIPIDNTVANAMAIVSEECIAAKKPVYVAADSMVRDGGLASVGVNYTNLGNLTAEMAVDILNGSDPATMAVQVLTDNNIVVNEETAAAIGVDVSQYA